MSVTRCISIEVPDDFPIFVPFDSLFMCRKHWVGLLGLFEETAFSAPLRLHHQVMVFRFHSSWLLQIIIHITLITGVYIYPAST